MKQPKTTSVKIDQTKKMGFFLQNPTIDKQHESNLHDISVNKHQESNLQSSPTKEQPHWIPHRYYETSREPKTNSTKKRKFISLGSSPNPDNKELQITEQKDTSVSSHSKAQADFLKQHQQHRCTIRMLRIIILVGFLALWQIAATLGWIDDFIFSSPVRLILCLREMILNGTIWQHVSITLIETLASFALVVLVTLIAAILLWANRSVSETCEPYMVVLNSLPKSALAPLLIVWLGANYRTIIVTGMSVAIFGSILSLYQGFLAVDKDRLKLIRTLGGNRLHELTKVVLPANIPTLFSIMKVDIGLCLVGVIIGEFISSRRGLGYMIIYGSQIFKLDWIILGIVILCGIAMGLYEILVLAEKRVCRTL